MREGLSVCLSFVPYCSLMGAVFVCWISSGFCGWSLLVGVLKLMSNPLHGNQ